MTHPKAPKKPSTLQSRNRARGIDNERGLVEVLKDLGVEDVIRIPLSGAIPIPGLPRGDLHSAKLQAVWEAKVLKVKTVIYEKTTTAARYVQLDLDWLDKIEKAAKDSRLPHAAVIFRGTKLRRRYVIIGLEEYIRLLKS